MKVRVFMAVLAASLLLSACGSDSGPKIGEQAHVKIDTASGTVVMAATEQDFAELVRAEAVGDKLGQQQLLSQSSRFMSVQNGTLVQVIDKGLAETISLRQVRIMDGPRKGQAGWLAWNWLGP